MNVTQWKFKKRTGGYRRKVRKAYEYIQKLNIDPSSLSVKLAEGSAGIWTDTANDKLVLEAREFNNISKNEFPSTCEFNSSEGSAHLIFQTNNVTVIDNSVDEGRYNSTDTDNDDEPILEHLVQYEEQCNYREDIRNWAVNHHLSHAALKDLLPILNKILHGTMPNDPRALLLTPRTITTIVVDPGEYWHNGLKKCIMRYFENAEKLPENISMSVNIDGLPVHKSSKQQFWPILCSILEKPKLAPIICGIYIGSAKPKDLSSFFRPFLDEMDDILRNGILIHNKVLKATLSCFVCDSPARAMIKGICNFNGKHGCPKCTVIGEYSHVSHTVIFPDVGCPLRTNQNFRERKYGDHHKFDSPLLELPIDMIEAFPVADSLHLIDLGIMKRLLIGWRDGNFGKKDTKWRASDIETVNIFLKSCKTPAEIHRAVRGLDCLSHWKGTEYRTFFYYLSAAILPNVMKEEALQHFNTLFCAITICSSEEHFQYLSLAEELLKYFVTHYKDFYGVDYITSNVHNLTHVVDEVRRFGTLEIFNAYKFENKLYMIKNLLRQGNKPLAQVAKRLCEYEQVDCEQNFDHQKSDYPYVRKHKKKHYLILHFKNFVLSTKREDKFFLTQKKEIMEITSITLHEKQIIIKCKKFDDLQNVFDLPIYSSFLNIFKSEANCHMSECICFPTDV